MPRSLAGWYVISLRPSGQHGGVRRAAAARGARAFALSTLRLEALPSAALERAIACPWVIATSPAAVRFAFAQAAPKRAQRWFAPGPGTAAALRRRGVAQVSIPADGHDSQHLLALPDLRQPGDRAIGLLTAPGGRDLLEPTLRARGAKVMRADVYRRVPMAPPAARLARLVALPKSSVLLVTSAEAFAGLWDALDAPGRRRLRARPAVAGSARLARLLDGLGFARIATAAGTRPAALLAAAATFASARVRDPLR